MRIIVEVLRGARTGQRMEFLDRAVITVGRDPSSDILLDPTQDVLASTRHAEIRTTPQGYLQWVDLGSSNGSFVNGARVTEAWLQSGSQVELGAGGPLLRFTLQSGAVAQATPAPPAAQTPATQPQARPPAAQPPVAPAAQATPAPAAQATPAPAAQATPAPGEEAKVGARTVAVMLESAIAKERTRKPRSTEFFRTLVDKEVRAKNRGLFYVTVVLGVLLVGAVAGGAIVIWRQRSDMEDQKAEMSRRGDVIKKERQRTQAEMDKLRAEAQKRRKEQALAIARLKQENERIKAMAKDRGPEVSKKNRAALYLLAAGRAGRPQYAVCTAFALKTRVLGTNAHCLVAMRGMARKGAHFFAVQNENPSFRVHVLKVRQHRGYRPAGRNLSPDLGLVLVDKDLPQTVTVATPTQLAEVTRGSLMFSFGFPGRLADPQKPIATLVHGRIGRLTRFDATHGTPAENQLLQHSALSMGGASGSPLFDGQGRLIGVHAGSYTSRSTETIIDPTTHVPKRILRAQRLGYKFGIRIDAIAPLLKRVDWESLEARGLFALASQIPAALKAVDCKAFGRTMSVCSKGRVAGKSMQARCEVAKRVATVSSVKTLTFATCVLAVRRCNRAQLSACIAKLK